MDAAVSESDETMDRPGSAPTPINSVIIVDWNFFYASTGSIGYDPDNVSQLSGAEVIEFSWVIYDVPSGEMVEREKRYIKPSVKSQAAEPSFPLEQSGIDPDEFHSSAVDLPQTITEFNAVVTGRRAASVLFSQVAVATFDRNKRNLFLSDANAKGAEISLLQVAFSQMLDLRGVFTYHYPQLTNAQIKHPHLLVQRLLPQTFDSHLAGLNLCVALGTALKRMTQTDGFNLTTDQLTVVDITDELVKPECFETCPPEVTEITAENSVSNTKQDSHTSSRKNKSPSESGTYFLKLRGLPWDATTPDVIQFFKTVVPDMRASDVDLVRDFEGVATGEAFVEVSTQSVKDTCARELNRKHIGSRYIEVFRCTMEDRRRGLSGSHSGFSFSRSGVIDKEKLGVIRLRGLPWSAQERDIVKFFEDNGHVVPKNNMLIGVAEHNRTSGEAWIVFPSTEEADSARKATHKKLIDRRYIEVFPSTFREVDSVLRGQVPHRSQHNGSGGPYGSVGRHNSSRRIYSTDRPSNESAYRGPGSPHSDHHHHHHPHYYNGHSSQGGGMDLDLVTNRRSSMGNRGPQYSGGDYRVRHSSGGGVPYTPHSDRGGRDVNVRRVRDRNVDYGFTVVRLRGLPYNASENDIMRFFQGYGMTAILPSTVPIDGKPSGEAYVEFVSAEEAFRAAKSCNGAKMEHRYIELFPGTKQEMDLAAAGLDAKEIRHRLSTSSSRGAERSNVSGKPFVV